MAIDLTTFWAGWDVVGGNTSATTQYDFWKGMIMSNGQVLANQYEFFEYHNTTRYEWFRDLQGTYPEVWDEYTFYKNTSDARIYDMRTFYYYGAEYLGGGPSPTTTTTTAAPVDPDYAAFMAAVVATGGTTNSTISAATQTLFTDLKAAGIYSKLDVLMPMIGGTYGSIVINAIQPTSSLWKWTNFGSSSIFSSAGLTGNGSGVLRSNFTFGDLVQSVSTSSHMGVYCSSLPTYGKALNGLINTANSVWFGTGTFDGGNGYGGQYANASYWSNVPTAGMWITNRTSTASEKFWVNGVSGAERTTTYTSNDISGLGMALLTLYWTVFPDNLYNGDLGNPTYATVTIGGGLNDTEISNLTTIITAFNTALSRN